MASSPSSLVDLELLVTLRGVAKRSVVVDLATTRGAWETVATKGEEELTTTRGA